MEVVLSISRQWAVVLSTFALVRKTQTHNRTTHLCFKLKIQKDVGRFDITMDDLRMT